MRDGYTYHLIGFNPEQTRTGYAQEILSHLANACKVDVQAYNPMRPADGLRAWEAPATPATPAYVAPVSATPMPSAPFDGGIVKPYGNDRGNGFKCYDAALKVTWLYNDHPDMARTWKARIGARWFPISERAALLSTLTPQQAVTAPPALPYTTPATPARRTRKR
jgi:hypothetical protein